MFISSHGIAALVLIIAFSLLQSGYLLVYLRKHDYWLQQLDAAENLMCPDCLYRVDGTLQQSRCPECGFAFDANDLKQRWTAWRTWMRRHVHIQRVMLAAFLTMAVLCGGLLLLILTGWFFYLIDMLR